MFTKKLETIFVTVIIFALLVLIINWNETKQFKNNPLSDKYRDLIIQKEQEILNNMQSHYGIRFKVPLIVTNEFKDKLYGVTVYSDGNIVIYLNKNVMQESMEYMLDSVIAHEYAHALMFYRGLNKANDDGHSSEWKDICINLGAKSCEKYVDMDEVIMGKMPF